MNYSKTKKGISSLLIFTLLFSISFRLPFYSFFDKKANAADEPFYNLVSIIVEEDIYNGIKSNLDRYATDIQGNLENTRVVIFPTPSDSTAFQIASLNEALYYEGYKGVKDDTNFDSKLIGTVLVGEIPIPVVFYNNESAKTLLPYVDFEDKTYIYDNEIEKYNRNENIKDSFKAEIWHGVINPNSSDDDNVALINDYFDKNHDFYEGTGEFQSSHGIINGNLNEINPPGYEPQVFYYDQYREEKTLNVGLYNGYETYQDNLEDIEYYKYDKTLADNSQKSTFGDQKEDIKDLAKEIQTETGESFEGDLSDDSDDSLISTETAPDTQTRHVTEKSSNTYLETINKASIGEIKKLIHNAGRYNKPGSEVNMDNVPYLISVADQMASQTSKGVANTLETRTEAGVKVGLSRHIGLPEKIFLNDKPGDIHEYVNFLYGKQAKDITNASECSIFKGNTRYDGQLVEMNRGYNIDNIKADIEKTSVGYLEVENIGKTTGYWGGCSPLNLNMDEINKGNFVLNFCNYDDAITPLFDMKGAKKSDDSENNPSSLKCYDNNFLMTFFQEYDEETGEHETVYALPIDGHSAVEFDGASSNIHFDFEKSFEEVFKSLPFEGLLEPNECDRGDDDDDEGSGGGNVYLNDKNKEFSYLDTLFAKTHAEFGGRSSETGGPETGPGLGDDDDDDDDDDDLGDDDDSANEADPEGCCVRRKMFLDGVGVKETLIDLPVSCDTLETCSFSTIDNECKKEFYYYNKITSYVEHESPTNQETGVQIQNLITPNMPIDRNRFIDFIGTNGEYYEVHFAHPFRVETPSERYFDEDVVNTNIYNETLNIPGGTFYASRIATDPALITGEDLEIYNILTTGPWPEKDLDLQRIFRDTDVGGTMPNADYTVDGDTKEIHYRHIFAFNTYWKNFQTLGEKYRFIFENYLGDQFGGNDEKYVLAKNKKIYEIGYIGAPGDPSNMYVKIDVGNKDDNPYADTISKNIELDTFISSSSNSSDTATDTSGNFTCGTSDGVPILSWMSTTDCWASSLNPPSLSYSERESSSSSTENISYNKRTIKKGKLVSATNNLYLTSDTGTSLNFFSDYSKYYTNDKGILSVEVEGLDNTKTNYINFELGKLEFVGTGGIETIFDLENDLLNSAENQKDVLKYLNFSNSQARIQNNEATTFFSTKIDNINVYFKASIVSKDSLGNIEVLLESEFLPIEVRGDKMSLKTYKLSSSDSIDYKIGEESLIVSDNMNIFLIDYDRNPIEDVISDINNSSNADEKMIISLGTYSRSGNDHTISYPIEIEILKDGEGFFYENNINSTSLNSYKNVIAIEESGDFDIIIIDNNGYKVTKTLIVKPDKVSSVDVQVTPSSIETGKTFTSHIAYFLDQYKNITTGYLYNYELSINGEGILFYDEEGNLTDQIFGQSIVGYKEFNLVSTDEEDENKIDLVLKEISGETVASNSGSIRTLNDILIESIPEDDEEIYVGGNSKEYILRINDIEGNLLSNFDSKAYVKVNPIYGEIEDAFVEIENGEGSFTYTTNDLAGEDIKFEYWVEGINKAGEYYITILPLDPIKIELSLSKDKIEAINDSYSTLYATLRDRYGNKVFNNSDLNLFLEIIGDRVGSTSKAILPGAITNVQGEDTTPIPQIKKVNKGEIDFKLYGTDYPGRGYFKVGQSGDADFETNSIIIPGQRSFSGSELEENVSDMIDDNVLTDLGNKFFSKIGGEELKDEIDTTQIKHRTNNTTEMPDASKFATLPITAEITKINFVPNSGDGLRIYYNGASSWDQDWFIMGICYEHITEGLICGFYDGRYAESGSFFKQFGAIAGKPYGIYLTNSDSTERSQVYLVEDWPSSHVNPLDTGNSCAPSDKWYKPFICDWLTEVSDDLPRIEGTEAMFKSRFPEKNLLISSEDYILQTTAIKNALKDFWDLTNTTEINGLIDNAGKIDTFYFWNKDKIKGKKYSSLYSFLLGAPYGDVEKEDNLSSAMLFDKGNRSLSVTSILNDPYSYENILAIESNGALLNMVEAAGTSTQDIASEVTIDSNKRLYIEIFNDALNTYIGKVYYNFNGSEVILNNCVEGVIENCLDEDETSATIEILDNDFTVSYNEELSIIDKYGKNVFSINDIGEIMKLSNIHLEVDKDNTKSYLSLLVNNGSDLIGKIIIKFVDADINITREKNLLDVKLGTLTNSIILYLDNKIYGTRKIGEREIIFYNDPLKTEGELNIFHKDNQDSIENFIKKEGIGWEGLNKTLLAFSAGKGVGEATKDYMSFSLINLGDPVIALKKIQPTLVESDNCKVSVEGEDGEFIGNTNGARPTYFFSKEGGEYCGGGSCSVVLDCDSGSETYDIANAGTKEYQGSFVWKPISETRGGVLAVLLPSSYGDGTDIEDDNGAAMRLFDPTMGKLIDNEEIETFESFDYNNDSREDLLLLKKDGYIKLLENKDIHSTFLNKGSLLNLIDLGSERLFKTGDFTGDSYDDVFFVNNESKPFLLNNVEKNFIRMPLEEIFALNGNIVQTSSYDMDNDSINDIIILDDSGELNIFYGGGDSDNPSFVKNTVSNDFGVKLNEAGTNNGWAVYYDGVSQQGEDEIDKFRYINIPYTPYSTGTSSTGSVDISSDISTGADQLTFIFSEYSSLGLSKKYEDRNGGYLQAGDVIDLEIELSASSNLNNMVLMYDLPKNFSKVTDLTLTGAIIKELIVTSGKGKYNISLEGFSLNSGETITLTQELEMLPMEYGFLQIGLHEADTVGDDLYGDIIIKGSKENKGEDAIIYKSTGPRSYSKDDISPEINQENVTLPTEIEKLSTDEDENGMPDYLDDIITGVIDENGNPLSSEEMDTTELEEYSASALSDLNKDKDCDCIPDLDDKVTKFDESSDTFSSVSGCDSKYNNSSSESGGDTTCVVTVQGETGQYHGNTNGNRPTFLFSKVGGDYCGGGACSVTATCDEGTYTYSIPDANEKSYQGEFMWFPISESNSKLAVLISSSLATESSEEEGGTSCGGSTTSDNGEYENRIGGTDTGFHHYNPDGSAENVPYSAFILCPNSPNISNCDNGFSFRGMETDNRPMFQKSLGGTGPINITCTSDAGDTYNYSISDAESWQNGSCDGTAEAPSSGEGSGPKGKGEFMGWATTLDNLNEEIDEAVELVDTLIDGFNCGFGGCISTPLNWAPLAPGGDPVLFGELIGDGCIIDEGIPIFSALTRFPYGPYCGPAIWPPSPLKNGCSGMSAGGRLGIDDASNFFRLFVTPTLTGGMGMAICFTGPAEEAGALPKEGVRPIILGGNCIVVAYPFFGCEGTNDGEPNAMGYPKKDVSGDYSTINGNSQKDTDKDDDSKYGHSPSGPLVQIGSQEEGQMETSVSVDTRAILSGDFSIDVIKIENQKVLAFPEFLMDWVDRQLKEFFTKLTDLPTVYIILPDFSGIFDDGWEGFGDSFESTIDNYNTDKEADKKERNTTIDGLRSQKTSLGCSEGNSSIKCATLDLQIESQSGLSNLGISETTSGIKAVYEFLGSIPLVNVKQEIVNVNIPWPPDVAGIDRISLDRSNSVAQRTDQLEKARVNWDPTELKDNVIVDITKLINSVENNIEILEDYKKTPEKISKIINVRERRLGQILENIDNAFGIILDRIPKNGKRFKAWVELYILIKAILKTWQLFIDIFNDYDTECHVCKNERNDSLGYFFKLISMLIPKLPIIEFPKWPDIIIDLHNIKAGLTIYLPDFNFNLRPIVLPTLPKLYLPDAPNLNITLPALPELPTFDLPDLPDIPVLPEISLPDIPAPPKIPELYGVVEVILKIAKLILKVKCLLNNLPFFPEHKAGDQIAFLTERTGYLPFDFIDLSFPTFSYSSVDAIKISTYVNLDLELDFITSMVKEVTRPLNSFSNDIVNMFNISIKDLDFRDTAPSDINIGFTDRDRSNIADFTDTIYNLSLLVSTKFEDFVKYIDDNKNNTLTNEEFITYISKELSSDIVTSDSRFDNVLLLWNNVRQLSYSKEDKIIKNLFDNATKKYQSVRDIVINEQKKNNKLKNEFSNLDNYSLFKEVNNKFEDVNIKDYNESLDEYNYSFYKSFIGLSNFEDDKEYLSDIKDSGNDIYNSIHAGIETLEVDNNDLLAIDYKTYENTDFSGFPPELDSEQKIKDNNMETLSGSYFYNYNGIYITQEGINYLLFDYLDEFRGNEKNINIDIDNDNDNDIIYIMEDRLYLKENLKEQAIKTYITLSPIILDSDDNKFFNGDIFYESINGFNEISISNLFVNANFRQPLDTGLNNFRLVLYTIVDKFINAEDNTYIPTGIKSFVIDAFSNTEKITLKEENDYFKIRQNLAYINYVGTVPNVVLKTKKLINIRDDLDTNNMVVLTAEKKLYSGADSFLIEYFTGSTNRIDGIDINSFTGTISQLIDNYSNIELTENINIIGLTGDAYITVDSEVDLESINDQLEEDAIVIINEGETLYSPDENIYIEYYINNQNDVKTITLGADSTIVLDNKINIVGLSGEIYKSNSAVEELRGNEIASFIGKPLITGAQIYIDGTGSVYNESSHIDITYYDESVNEIDFRETSDYLLYNIWSNSDSYSIRTKMPNDYYYAKIKSFSGNIFGTESKQLLLAPQNEADDTAPEIEYSQNIDIPLFDSGSIDFTSYIYENSGIDNIKDVYIDFDLEVDSDNDGDFENDNNNETANITVNNGTGSISIDFGPYNQEYDKTIRLFLVDTNNNIGYKDLGFTVSSSGVLDEYVEY